MKIYTKVYYYLYISEWSKYGHKGTQDIKIARHSIIPMEIC